MSRLSNLDEWVRYQGLRGEFEGLHFSTNEIVRDRERSSMQHQICEAIIFEKFTNELHCGGQNDLVLARNTDSHIKKTLKAASTATAEQTAASVEHVLWHALRAKQRLPLGQRTRHSNEQEALEEVFTAVRHSMLTNNPDEVIERLEQAAAASADAISMLQRNVECRKKQNTEFRLELRTLTRRLQRMEMEVSPSCLMRALSVVAAYLGY